MDFGGGKEIRFERRGKAGVVTLTRPKALNAVTHRMVNALTAALEAWAADDAVDAVVIQAEGRAFSAGGDLLDLYRARQAGESRLGFFRDEYLLNAAIARFEKPYVALIDGIVMGGGVGISAHGSHRVLGEKAEFAMPETGIGFFPDVGGSFILSHLKGGFGMFLGLTGKRIGPGDTLACGIGTHAVRSEDFPAILAGIAETGTPDAVLAPFQLSPPPAPLLNEAEKLAIGHHFTLGSLGDLIASLEKAAADGDEFATGALGLLAGRSPTSLHVAFRQITFGAMLSMDECMRMEFRIVTRMLGGDDFFEGIRAVMIDKGDTPTWRPATLDEIDEAAIEAYFDPLPGGELGI
ncbi:MAG: enoyl-CoA hydratase/isomerase family protein [Mesorhizobium sp.]|nr:enoyl-CoA hydratase/isomerase family protein [Mesorhizobium sp.]